MRVKNSNNNFDNNTNNNSNNNNFLIMVRWIKEDEKVEEYQDLAGEMRKTWHVKTKAIPVVLGEFGSIPLRLKDNLRITEVCIPVELIQRSAFLGLARKLRKMLGIYCREENKTNKGYVSVGFPRKLVIGQSQWTNQLQYHQKLCEFSII